MTKKIISQFIIILIILFTALSIFWFLKTSAVKKQILALISASDGKISAASVSVSGFPLKQKVVIGDLKLQLAMNLPKNPLILATNKYQINIQKLEAISSILSSNFKVNNILNISIQDQDPQVNSIIHQLQFNQPPQAGFSITSAGLTKLSYQDSGYKILDEGKNILFENGNSLINFESIIVDNKYHNKIRVEFKDVGMLSNIASNLTPATKENLPDAVATDATSNPTTNDNSPSANNVNNVVTPDNNVQPKDVEANTNPTQPIANTSTDGGLIKKSFVIDLEYIMDKPSLLPAEVPAPNTTESKAVGDVIPYKSRLESMTIKDFAISSPLYKININGEISSFSQDGLPIANISARIEKFNNLLIALKPQIASISAAITTSRNLQNAPAPEVANVSVNANNVATPSSLTIDSPNAQNNDNKPVVNIEATIIDIANKNPATNDEVAVFDFRQELGKDLLINEIPLTEIIAQDSSLINNNPSNNSTDDAITPSIAATPTSEAPPQPKPVNSTP